MTDGAASLSVMPARSPSVMPDVCNRASSILSSPSSGTPCHARLPWISSEDGFPLKTCGNDRKGGRQEGRRREGREGRRWEGQKGRQREGQKGRRWEGQKGRQREGQEGRRWEGQKGRQREGQEGELAGIHSTDEEFLGFEALGTWIRFGVQGNGNVSPPGRTLPLGLLRRPIHFHPPATIEARNAIPGFSTGIWERGKHDGSPIIRTDGLKMQKMFIHHRL